MLQVGKLYCTHSGHFVRVSSYISAKRFSYRGIVELVDGVLEVHYTADGRSELVGCRDLDIEVPLAGHSPWVQQAGKIAHISA